MHEFRGRNSVKGGGGGGGGENVKPEKNSIFLKKGKTVITVENRKFSRSRMTKQTVPIIRPTKSSDLEKFRRILRQSEYCTIFWVLSHQ